MTSISTKHRISRNLRRCKLKKHYKTRSRSCQQGKAGQAECTWRQGKQARQAKKPGIPSCRAASQGARHLYKRKSYIYEWHYATVVTSSVSCFFLCYPVTFAMGKRFFSEPSPRALGGLPIKRMN